jgi:hypothetical protein
MPESRQDAENQSPTSRCVWSLKKHLGTLSNERLSFPGGAGKFDDGQRRESSFVTTTARGAKMKSRLIVVAAFLLVVMPRAAVAQTPRATRASAAAEPPPLSLQNFASTSPPDGIIEHLFAFQPAIPLGPVDVLKEYEDGMTLIAQRLSAELISISQANRASQITRNEAEYLIQDRYRVAMMQHEVLSALHDSLQHDLAQAASPGSVSPSDTTVLVLPPWQVRTQ